MELKTGFETPFREKERKNHIRNIKYSALGYGVYSLFFCVAYTLNLFNIDFLHLLTILSSVWFGNLFLYWIIGSRLNEGFEDSYLTSTIILWAIITIITPTYYMGELRPVFLMAYFLAMILGAFKLSLKEFLILTTIGVINLGLVLIFLVKNDYPNTKIGNELILWIIFTFLAYSFAFICNNISMLRKNLINQKKELQLAFSDAQKTSITDDLTGSYNRRYLLEHLKTLKIKTDKGLDTFCLAMFDIDHFKKINDTYGHEFGDRILKELNKIVNKIIRNDDSFSRYGGEEFMLVLAHVDSRVALQIVERIKNEVEKFRISEKPDFSFTVSIGLSQYVGEDIGEIMRRVEDLIYKSKSDGRNKITVG